MSQRRNPRGPLSDPRSLAVSMLVHTALLLIAANAASNSAPPVEHSSRGRLKVVLGPPSRPKTTVKGDSGAASPSVIVPNHAPAAFAKSPDRERAKTESSASGASHSFPNGSSAFGGGDGRGTGRGAAITTEFFGTFESAATYAYVIDCSGSMAERRALDVAKRELLASLDRLAPAARFAVIFYSGEPRMLLSGQPALVAATVENKARVRTLLAGVRADGGTDHRAALLLALQARPEVIFLLTDAELFHQDLANALRERVVREGVRIQAVEITDGPHRGGTDPLRQLAQISGGSFKSVDLSRTKAP